MLEGCRLLTLAESLAGRIFNFRTATETQASVLPETRNRSASPTARARLRRLEDTDDIIADLDQAVGKIK